MTMEARMRARTCRRAAPFLAVLLLGACGQVQLGDVDQPPPWRRPGPALLEPQERHVLPHDGYRAGMPRPAAPVA